MALVFWGTWSDGTWNVSMWTRVPRKDGQMKFPVNSFDITAESIEVIVQ